MSNRLSRDTEDAAKVLSRLRDKYHPRETLEQKLSAAEDLRAKLVNVATGVPQWSIKAAGDDSLVTLSGAGTVRVRTDIDSGHLLVDIDGAPSEEVPLEYDPVNQEWIGTEVDAEIVTAPGERKARKAALVALCETIVRVLERAGSSAPRAGAR